jgi:glycosyltransferase involved in cell wall biosynthesis
LRILFLAPEPFFEVRGTPINIRQLLYSIGDMGHKVDLLTYHIGKDVSLKNANIYRIAKVPFIRYVPIGPSFVKIILDPFLFLKSIKMVISERYDLIHAVEESVFIAFVIKKLFKVPYIYDMDSCISDQLAYTGKLKNRLLLKFISSLEKIVIRNSLTVLTVCSALTELAACAAPDKKIFQVEDCAIEFPEKKIGLTRKKLDISEDSIIIMYVGNFETYQGIEMLLESLSIVLKDEISVRLLLIGGEPQQIQKLRAYAGRAGILGSVSFQGKKAFEEIPSYLEAADILVSPRLKGTTPGIFLKVFYIS